MAAKKKKNPIIVNWDNVAEEMQKKGFFLDPREKGPESGNGFISKSCFYVLSKPTATTRVLTVYYNPREDTASQQKRFLALEAEFQSVFRNRKPFMCLLQDVEFIAKWGVNFDRERKELKKAGAKFSEI
jgi:hypothetical protein